MFRSPYRLTNHPVQIYYLEKNEHVDISYVIRVILLFVRDVTFMDSVYLQ
jgi:hypothetical protein